MKKDIKQYAKMSQMHYNFDKEPTDKQRHEVEKAFKGYKVDKKSDHNVMGLYNEDKKHLVINHRGSSKTEDWLSDLMHGAGYGELEPQANSRRKQTKEMIKQYPNDTKVTLTGHSFGGATVLESLNKSESLNKHIHDVHLFNPFHARIHSKNDKVHIHRTASDVASVLPSFNKTHTYKKEYQNPLTAHKLDNFY